MNAKSITAMGVALALSACASMPQPNAALENARAAVQTDHDAQPATQLAEQAIADAQLAEATAQEKHSRKAAMELDASLQALKQESSRNTQPNQ